MDTLRKRYAVSYGVNALFPIFPIALEVNSGGAEILELMYERIDFSKLGWGGMNEHIDESVMAEFFPDSIYLAYIGIIEKESYVIEGSLRGAKGCWDSYLNDDGTPMFSRILIGIAPYGSAACWLWGRKKSVLVMWEKACETIKITTGFCDEYLKKFYPAMDNLSKNGYPPRDLYENYMKQYCYRYCVMFEEWDEEGKPAADGELLHWRKYTEEEESGGEFPVFDHLEESLSDGTHDELHDGGLMKYHDAGKPDKLAIRWHVGKSEYSAYFWFDPVKICGIYDRFYGAHRDVRSDFIIRIDTLKKKYELSMYRYGLKRPVPIPEDAYQLLVFKNKFENFRSANYTQEDGAYDWYNTPNF